MPCRVRGFSLIELAVVLVIIGLLLGGGIAAFTAVAEQTNRSEQRAQLDTARDALYGFAMSEGRLPCPDVSDPLDGDEDRDTSVSPVECTAQEGALPWSDLGIGRLDAWGQPLRYRVTTAAGGGAADDFAEEVPGGDAATFAVGSKGDIEVSETAGGGDDVAGNIVALVISYGEQGDQVWTNEDATITCPGAGVSGFSSEENENCNGGDEFVQTGYRPASVGEGFDDMLTWIPYTVLTARMVEAGRLP